MAKNFYNQRASIDQSRLDYAVSIDLWGINFKPLPIKVYLYWVAVFFLIVFVSFQSPLASAPVFLLVLVDVWIVVTAAYFGSRLKTGEMRFKLIPVVAQFFQPGERKVMTRKYSSPYDFMSVVGIRDIDDTGLIQFLDGTVGKAYSVVGSASRLLFDSDRAMIVNRVDNFWRKIELGAEWQFVTIREPQRVFRQIASLERTNRNLKYEDDAGDLRGLLQEQYTVCADEVGDKYESIHQYLIIKAKNIDELQNAHRILASEVEGSSLMFKQCTMLDANATIDMLRGIFRYRFGADV